MLGFLISGVVSLLGAFWIGYRTVPVRTAYKSITEGGSEATASRDEGAATTVEGTVTVDKPVAVSAGDDRFVESADRPALVVWRLRRGSRSGFDDWVGTSGDWKTVASGIEAGSFGLDDGTQTVRVDPTWLLEHRGVTDLSSLTMADLDPYGPWTERAWDSLYVHAIGAQEAFTLAERTVLQPDLRARLADDRYRYQFQLRVVSAGDRLAVHGRIGVDRGDPVLRGADDAPMVISDGGTDALERSVRNQTLKRGAYLVAEFSIAVVCFALVVVLTGAV